MNEESIIMTTALYAQGNPGALMFMMGLISAEGIQYSIPITTKLEEIPSLKGTNLYVLWSDLGNKDYAQVAKICESVPNDILEDACSRQDYSGRELIKPYLEQDDPHDDPSDTIHLEQT